MQARAESFCLGRITYLHVVGQGLVFLNTPEAAFDLMDKRGAIYSDKPHLVMLGELYVYSNLPRSRSHLARSKLRMREHGGLYSIWRSGAPSAEADASSAWAVQHQTLPLVARARNEAVPQRASRRSIQVSGSPPPVRFGFHSFFSSLFLWRLTLVTCLGTPVG